MNSYYEELEYDLAGIGTDLQDFWRGRITLRRLHVLITGLPVTSATKSAIAGHPMWPDLNHQIADLIDIQAKAVFKDPKPYPRPGDRERAARALSARADRWMKRNQKPEGVQR